MGPEKDEAERAFALLNDLHTAMVWANRKADLPDTKLETLTQIRDQLDDLVTKIIKADEGLGMLPQTPRITSLRGESGTAVAKVLALTFGGRVPRIRGR